MQSMIKPARLALRAPCSLHLVPPTVAAYPVRFTHSGTEASLNKKPSTNSSQSSSTSDKSDSASPAIHHPESAAEKDDPEVRKHNEEMRNRSDQAINQLSEKDNKVHPEYWKGHVGEKK